MILHSRIKSNDCSHQRWLRENNNTQVFRQQLLARLSHDIKDKRELKLIRRYLTADVLQKGIVEQRQQGTPQGGSLSPLLSNIVLDELDKELEKRGHSFSALASCVALPPASMQSCRYAGDCNIYVSSQAAAERVMASVKGFIEGKLKLKVNDLKSACAKAVWANGSDGGCGVIDSSNANEVIALRTGLSVWV